MIETYKVLLE